MKKFVIMAVLAAVTLAFTGCKKEESLGDKIDKVAQQAEKEANNLQKKLDEQLKK